ncbi:MAG: DNA polymerase III subunit beta [Bacteroidales bacterium]|nr:DNA polymerase III subunit beta [Bacteroidales bacterium]
MKFYVSSVSLFSALQSLGKVIESKNFFPILDCFLFELYGEKLVITASDRETMLVAGIDVITAEGSGSFAIESKRLPESLKDLSGQTLTVTVDTDYWTVNIEYENGCFNLIGCDSNKYPPPKSLKYTAVTVNVESQIVLNGINRTLFAAAVDELRPVMNGVYFDFKPDSLTFVASDGYRLVRMRNYAVKCGVETSFILPPKPANLLKGLLPNNSDIITITFDYNNARFTTPDFEMFFKLIEGRFPNYKAVIPVESPNVATIDRLSLLAALKRTSVYANQEKGRVKLELSENEIHVVAYDIDFDTSAEEKVVCRYSAIPFHIGFKASLLIEILANISASEVLLQLEDPSRPAIIVPSANEDNEDMLMLLMPVLLDD